MVKDTHLSSGRYKRVGFIDRTHLSSKFLELIRWIIFFDIEVKKTEMIPVPVSQEEKDEWMFI